MQELDKLSVFKNIENWKTPVLLTRGENDDRTRGEDVEKFKKMLQEKRIPVWYISATNEGHVWNSSSNIGYVRDASFLFLKNLLK